MTNRPDAQPLFAAIEGGGTKFVCAVGASHDDILETITIPTRKATETLNDCRAFFEDCAEKYGAISATGIGIFGPIDVDPQSVRYGQLLAACKPGWEGANVHKYFAEQLKCPVAIDTDVNAAVLAEISHGAAHRLRSTAYVTVGTGIGVGLCIDGRTLKGRLHPELGHIAVPRAPGDNHPSICPFHEDCFEGMASGPALKARTGMPAETLPADHPAWDHEAYYLAQLCRTISYAAAPQRIVMGGGVMHKPILLPKVLRAFTEISGGFAGLPQTVDAATNYIVPQQLGGVSGLHGAFLLAARARESV